VRRFVAAHPVVVLTGVVAIGFFEGFGIAPNGRLGANPSMPAPVGFTVSTGGWWRCLSLRQ
jgi:hypothetical protein